MSLLAVQVLKERAYSVDKASAYKTLAEKTSGSTSSVSNETDDRSDHLQGMAGQAVYILTPSQIMKEGT